MRAPRPIIGLLGLPPAGLLAGRSGAPRRTPEPVAVRGPKPVAREGYRKVPQDVCQVVGGVTPPLLANILLDELDREVERRGHAFCRYADDVRIDVRSQRAGERVVASVARFLARTLRLQVNHAKSAVARTRERTFLGYRIRGRAPARLGIAPESLRRAKDIVRRITKRNRGVSVERVLQRAPGVHGRLGGLLLAWPARRRCSRRSTSGSDGGCGATSGNSGRPRSAALRHSAPSPHRAPVRSRVAVRGVPQGQRGQACALQRDPQRTRLPQPPRSLSCACGWVNRPVRTRIPGGVGGGAGDGSAYPITEPPRPRRLRIRCRVSGRSPGSSD